MLDRALTGRRRGWTSRSSIYIYEIHIARAWRRKGLGSFLMQEALSAARAARISTVLLTRWTALGSTGSRCGGERAGRPSDIDMYDPQRFLLNEYGWGL